MSKDNRKEVQIPVAGSLGLLAYGDIGVKAWRNVRDKAKAAEESSEDSKNKENNKENE